MTTAVPARPGAFPPNNVPTSFHHENPQVRFTVIHGVFPGMGVSEKGHILNGGGNQEGQSADLVCPLALGGSEGSVRKAYLLFCLDLLQGLRRMSLDKMAQESVSYCPEGAC